MKYSGEAKMSSGQRMLEEFQSHLEQAQTKLAFISRVQSFPSHMWYASAGGVRAKQRRTGLVAYWCRLKVV